MSSCRARKPVSKFPADRVRIAFSQSSSCRRLHRPKTSPTSSSSIRTCTPRSAVSGSVPRDSDGDGLVDAFEAELDGFHPHRYGMAMSERSFGVSLWANSIRGHDVAAQHRRRGDPDETVLSPLRNNASARDPAFLTQMGMDSPDGLELREGSDPRSTTGADPDHDGLSVAFEIRQHTHPGLDEGEDPALR